MKGTASTTRTGTPIGLKTTIGRLVHMLRPYMVALGGAMLLLLALAVVNMAIPACIGLLFNYVFPDKLWWVLWSILPFILLVYILRNVLYLGTKYIALHVGEQVSFQLRRKLFQSLQARDLQFFQNQNAGKLSSRVMDDTFSVQTFVQEDLPKLMQSACLFTALMLVVYVLNWQLALVTTLVLPLHLIVFRLFKSPISTAGGEAQQQLSNTHGNLVEKFLGMEVVQGFGAEQRENESFVDAIDATRRSQLASKRLHVGQKIAADILIGLGTVALLGFGGYQVMRDHGAAMAPGTFIAYFGFVGMLYPTVSELMGSMAKMVRAGASMDRIQAILLSSHQAHPGTAWQGPIEGTFGFYWVSARRSGGKPILKDVTLDIPAGVFCMVTGPSGSGKSTLVSLLPRFVEPSHGRILLDRLDLSSTDTDRLRQAIGYVFQEPFFFNATVADNLRYALPDASPEQIDRAAEATTADALIRRLPDGLETMLGESGWELSRGEKQILAVTRALVKDPRILIMDEATSSLGVGTEQVIVSRVKQFMTGRTTLMVTHRPDLFHYADMIVVLDRGRIAFHGPPDELPPDTREDLGMDAPITAPPQPTGSTL